MDEEERKDYETNDQGRLDDKNFWYSEKKEKKKKKILYNTQISWVIRDTKKKKKSAKGSIDIKRSV